MEISCQRGMHFRVVASFRSSPFIIYLSFYIYLFIYLSIIYYIKMIFYMYIGLVEKTCELCEMPYFILLKKTTLAF